MSFSNVNRGEKMVQRTEPWDAKMLEVGEMGRTADKTKRDQLGDRNKPRERVVPEAN